MKRQDEHEDSSKPEPKGVPGASAGDHVVPPRAPFAPPVRDPSVLAILNGLNPSVTPRPMQVAATDGEMAASFAAGPRNAPVAEETPAAEASVVVKATVSTPPKKQASRERVDTTFRLRPRKSSLGLPVAIGVLVLGVAVAAWLGHTGTTEQAIRPAPAPSASPGPTVATTPAIPNIPPPDPVPTADEPAPALLSPAVVPVRSTASPRTAPSIAPVRPTKRDPSRAKEDEPERVL